MYDASTEVSLAAHSSLVKELADHIPVVLFTKEIMDTDNSDPVVNIPPVIFIGGLSNQLITGNIQGSWDP